MRMSPLSVIALFALLAPGPSAAGHGITITEIHAQPAPGGAAFVGGTSVSLSLDSGATDLAEVLGTIVGLNLLFGLPLLWGCAVTAMDTFLPLGVCRKRAASCRASSSLSVRSTRSNPLRRQTASASYLC